MPCHRNPLYCSIIRRCFDLVATRSAFLLLSLSLDSSIKSELSRSILVRKWTGKFAGKTLPLESTYSTLTFNKKCVEQAYFPFFSILTSAHNPHSDILSHPFPLSLSFLCCYFSFPFFPFHFPFISLLSFSFLCYSPMRTNLIPNVLNY